MTFIKINKGTTEILFFLSYFITQLELNNLDIYIWIGDSGLGKMFGLQDVDFKNLPALTGSSVGELGR